MWGRYKFYVTFQSVRSNNGKWQLSYVTDFLNLDPSIWRCVFLVVHVHMLAHAPLTLIKLFTAHDHSANMAWPPPNNTMMPMPLPHSSSTYGNNHAAKKPLSFPRCKKPAAIVASLFRQQRLHCQHLHCQHLHCQCSLRQRLRCWRCPAMDLPSVVSILSLVTSPFIHLMIKIEGHPSARRRKWSRLTYFFWNTHLYGVLADFHCCFFVLWHSSSHSQFAYEPLCIFYTGISSVPFVMLPDILMRWWKEQQSASPSTQQIMMHGRVGSIWQSILIRGGGYQSKHNLQKMNWITIWAKVRAHWCLGISYI